MLSELTRARQERSRHSASGGRGPERSRVARPTLAAVLFVASGLMVLATVLATGATRDLPVTLSSTTTPVAVLIGCCLAACGVSVWAQPSTRVFAGLMGLAASLAALPGANLGGALLGTVLGVVASAAALSWTPHAEESGTPAEARDAVDRDGRTVPDDRDASDVPSGLQAHPSPGDRHGDASTGTASTGPASTGPAAGRDRPARHRVSV